MISQMESFNINPSRTYQSFFNTKLWSCKPPKVTKITCSRVATNNCSKLGIHFRHFQSHAMTVLPSPYQHCRNFRTVLKPKTIDSKRGKGLEFNIIVFVFNEIAFYCIKSINLNNLKTACSHQLNSKFCLYSISIITSAAVVHCVSITELQSFFPW